MIVKNSYIINLPNELIIEIFGYLDRKTLQAFMNTSHKLRVLGIDFIKKNKHLILGDNILTKDSLDPLIDAIATNAGKNLQINIVPINQLLKLHYKIVQEYMNDKNPLQQVQFEFDRATKTKYTDYNCFFKIALTRGKNKSNKPIVLNFAYKYSHEEQEKFYFRVESKDLFSKRRWQHLLVDNRLTEELDIISMLFTNLNRFERN